MIALTIFTIFGLFFWISPGLIVLDWTNLKTSLYTKLNLALVIGILIFLLSALLFKFLRVPFEVLFLLPIVSLFQIRKILFFLMRNKKVFLNSFSPIFLIFQGLTTLALTFQHLTSGYTQGSLYLAAARDTFWRISIIEELIHHFPPQIPGFSGEYLTNYHYFYDVLIAATQSITRIETIELYSHFFSILAAVLFFGMLYQFLRIFITNKYLTLFGTVLIIWAGNLSYALPYLSSQYSFTAQSNIFMSDQPFDQGHNPFNLFAYALFISVFYLFHYWQKTKNYKIFLVISLVISLLVGIKVYAAIIILASLGIVVLYEIIVNKKFTRYFIVPFICALPSFFLIKGKGFSILTFNPGWVLVKMIEDRDRLFLIDWALRRQQYEATHNYIRLILQTAKELTIYIVGNFGIRLFSILFFIKKLRNPFFSSSLLIFMGSAIVISTCIPLLFSQSRAPYDSVQFTPYALLLAGIFLVLALERVLKKRLYAGTKVFDAVIWVLFFAIAVPSNVVLVYNARNNAKTRISQEEVSGLAFIKNYTTIDSIILSDLEEIKMELMYIPALSGRRTFLSGPTLAQQLGVDISSRYQNTKDFFMYDPITHKNQLSQKYEFLNRNKISYVYLSNTGLRHKMLMDDLKLTAIYEKDGILIYQVP